MFENYSTYSRKLKYTDLLKDCEYEKVVTDKTDLEKVKYLKFNRKSDFYKKPIDLSEFPNLEGLTLFVENGELPSELFELRKLKVLNLYYSGLEIASAINNLTELEALYINMIDDSTELAMPKSISGLSKLNQLEIVFNPFQKKRSATLPSDIGQLKNLEYLVAALDDIPDSLYELESLEFLALKTSKIDSRIERLSKLEELFLYELEMEIPESIGRLHSLKMLRIYDCVFEAGIPDSIGDLSNLEVLDIYQNPNLKRIPGSINSLPNLKELTIVSNDSLTSIDDLSNLEQLTDIGLNGNRFSKLHIGSGLPNVESLYANNNQITEIPASIKDLKSLKFLGLSFNDIRVVPGYLGVLPKLQTVDLVGNSISDIEEGFFKSKSLESLNLSLNELEEIPESIGSLAKLDSLILVGNKISTIPDSIKQLGKLENLILSCNRMKEIPAVLNELPSLKYVDLGNDDYYEYHDDHLPVGKELMENSIEKWEGDISKFNSLERLFIHVGDKSVITTLSKLSKLSFLNLYYVDEDHRDLFQLLSLSTTGVAKMPNVSESFKLPKGWKVCERHGWGCFYRYGS